MKLKRLITGILTGALVIANVPVLGLGGITAMADNDAADGKTYRYRAVDGMTVSADANFRLDAPLENILMDGSGFALTRYNTGGIPRSTMLTARNNIYLALDSAQAVSSLRWWTDNDAVSGGYGWEVEQGTVTRCKVYLTTDSISKDSKDSVIGATWTEQTKTEDVRFDSNENDNKNNDITCVAHDIVFADIFETVPENVTGIRIEVLNTAGEYIGKYSEGGPSDNRDKFINGREVEVFASEDKLTVTPYADFACQSSEELSKLVDGTITHASRMHSLWNPAAGETAENGESPYKYDAGHYIANNNLYFTLPEKKTIGKLTYVAGTTNGSIQRCRIYVSDSDQELKDIKDWGDPVFNNADDDNDETDWATYDPLKGALGNSHEAVFDTVKEAKYVRIEVVNTRGTATDINNKWISGRRVYIYEAEEVVPDETTILDIDIEVAAPVYGSPLSRPQTLSGANYYVKQDNGFEWYQGDAKEEDADFGTGVYKLKTYIETVSPVSNFLKATVNGKIAEIENVQKNAENGTATLTVVYTFPEIEDPTSAWTALKTYVTDTAKAAYDAGNESEDGSQKYTTRSWKRFADAYEKAYVWTVNTVLDGSNSSSGAGQVISSPSGHSKAEYEEMLANITAWQNGMIAIGDRKEIDVTKDVPDVTVTAPEGGAAPADAWLTNPGTIENENITLQYRNDFHVDDNGFVHGGVIAPNGLPGNDLFDITGNTPFMIRFKTIIPKKITKKESIVGRMNNGYGVQIQPGGGNNTTQTLLVYGFVNDSTWPQTDFQITSEDWYGVEHDIVVIFDRDHFDMYVDGVAGTDSRTDKHGALSSNAAAVFTIGYNAGNKDASETEDFSGGLKDFVMYIGDNCPDYSQLESAAGTQEFATKLQTALDSKEPDLTLTGEVTKYDMMETTWEAVEGDTSTPMEENETFDEYKDYKVTAVLDTTLGYYFSDAEGFLRTGAGEDNVLKSEIDLNDDQTELSFTYMFEGKEHPYDALNKLLADLEDRKITEDSNKDENGVRIYTIASWNTFTGALSKAKELVKEAMDAEKVEDYKAALTELQTAFDDLELAAETCECEITAITGFEDGSERTLDMGTDTSKTEELSTGVSASYSTDNCMVHSSQEPDFKFDLGDNTAGASVNGTVLTVTRRGTVEVVLTVTLGDAELTSTVTYTVTGTAASEEERNGLQTEISGAKNKYPESVKDLYTSESWDELQDAIANAEEVIADPASTPGDIALASQRLSEAMDKLVKKPDGGDEAAKAQAKLNIAKAVADAAPLIKAGKGNYTNESWSVFEKAYKDANIGEEALDAMTAEDIQALADALARAQAGLKENTSNGPVLTVGKTVTVASGVYQVTNAVNKEVVLTKGTDTKTVTIPATVSVDGIDCKVVGIGDNAFKSAAKLANIVIGDNVTSIGNTAFSGAKQLKKVTIGKSVTTIGKKAFFNCKKLKNVVVKGTAIKKIGAKAFKGTAAKIKVKLPKMKAKQKNKLKTLFKKAKISSKAAIK